MKKYILILAILILATQSMNAQVTSVSVETYYSYDGLVAGYPEGHTTYRIYANLTNHHCLSTYRAMEYGTKSMAEELLFRIIVPTMKQRLQRNMIPS
jgi:hypothetical protein